MFQCFRQNLTRRFLIMLSLLSVSILYPKTYFLDIRKNTQFQWAYALKQIWLIYGKLNLVNLCLTFYIDGMKHLIKIGKVQNAPKMSNTFHKIFLMQSSWGSFHCKQRSHYTEQLYDTIRDGWTYWLIRKKFMRSRLPKYLLVTKNCIYWKVMSDLFFWLMLFKVQKNVENHLQGSEIFSDVQIFIERIQNRKCKPFSVLVHD